MAKCAIDNMVSSNTCIRSSMHNCTYHYMTISWAHSYTFDILACIGHVCIH